MSRNTSTSTDNDHHHPFSGYSTPRSRLPKGAASSSARLCISQQQRTPDIRPNPPGQITFARKWNDHAHAASRSGTRIEPKMDLFHFVCPMSPLPPFSGNLGCFVDRGLLLGHVVTGPPIHIPVTPASLSSLGRKPSLFLNFLLAPSRTQVLIQAVSASDRCTPGPLVNLAAFSMPGGGVLVLFQLAYCWPRSHHGLALYAMPLSYRASRGSFISTGLGGSLDDAFEVFPSFSGNLTRFPLL